MHFACLTRDAWTLYPRWTGALQRHTCLPWRNHIREHCTCFYRAPSSEQLTAPQAKCCMKNEGACAHVFEGKAKASPAEQRCQHTQYRTGVSWGCMQPLLLRTCLEVPQSWSCVLVLPACKCPQSSSAVLRHPKAEPTHLQQSDGLCPDELSHKTALPQAPAI